MMRVGGVYKAVEQLAMWLERFGQSKRLLEWKLCWAEVVIFLSDTKKLGEVFKFLLLEVIADELELREGIQEEQSGPGRFEFE